LISIFAIPTSHALPQSIYGKEKPAPARQARFEIPQGWTIHRGQSGLIVFHPQEWKVQEQGGGAFVAFRPGAGGGATAVVYVQPMEKIEGKSSGVVQGLDKIAPQLFPEVRVTGLRVASTKPEVAVGEIAFSPRGQAFQGVAMCFKQDLKGVLYVIASARSTYLQDEPVMKQILSRFFYSGESGQGEGASAITMVSWRDPLEGAFTCPVPQGWKVDGGMKRFSAIDTRAEVLAISPDNRVLVRLGDSSIPPMVVPTQMMMSLGFHEGRWYAPDGVNNQLIMRYLPSMTFLTQFYLPQRVGQVTNVQSRDLPEISQQMVGPWRMAGMNVRMDTGEITFDTQTEGGPRKGYCFAQTVLVPFPPPTEGGGWYVTAFNSYLSDPKMEPTAQMVLNQMVAEYRKDPNWEAQQLRTTARVSQIQRQAQQETSNIINQTFQNRSRAQDRMHEKWTRTFRGQVLIEDPTTNQRYEVPSGSNYYWRIGTGQDFIGTETSDKPYHPNSYIQEMRILP
jgi:hypothetical protein